MPKGAEMNGSQLLRLLAQHEMLIWLRNTSGWVLDIDLEEAMDLSRADIVAIRGPLTALGYIETCVGASRLTGYGRDHADDLLQQMLSGEPLSGPVDDANEMS